jgi:hypothetical protein
VLVRDSYPTLGWEGWEGHHLQPTEIVAAAIERDDGHGGGVLAIASAGTHADVVALAADLGLDTELWDNGTASRR